MHRLAEAPTRVIAGNGTGAVAGWSVDEYADVHALVVLDDEDSYAHDGTWLADPAELHYVAAH